jgi:hypothetical protein
VKTVHPNVSPTVSPPVLAVLEEDCVSGVGIVGEPDDEVDVGGC